MRNLKRALSLGLTAAMISGLMVMGSSAASYADVTSEDNQEAIEVLQAVEIMVGDENGDFNPDQNVTRNEMAVIMANLMEYNVASYKNTSPFTDVPSWAEPYVAACWTNGITAGYSDTIYGGSDTVTTAQAALMLMKALGYFQYASDFGSDWQLATTRQGNAIDLFVGVDSGVTQAMTRNDVAQLVLNTLKSGTVEASTDGSWTIGDVTINNNVTYSYITSNQDYADAIDDVKSTSNTTDANRSIVELGEQLYMGDLKLNDEATDVFGRPARYWEYGGDEIGTYAKTELLRETYTTEVTGRDLYNLLGKTAIDDNTLFVYVDGEDENLGDAAFGKADMVKKNDETIGRTGNGVLTQVFLDTQDDEITVAIINTYLAKAAEDYDEKNDDVDLDVYYVDNNGTSRKPVYMKTADEDKPQKQTISVDGEDFAIEEVAENDLFLVTIAQGVIQTMDAPEVLSDTSISNFRLEKYVTAGGTQYDYADTVMYDEEVLDQYDDANMKDVTYNVILDAYGYMIGIEQNEDPDQYVFLTGIDGKNSNLSVRNADANVIFMDGNMDTVTVNMTKSDIDTTGKNLSQLNTWCTYTVNNDNVYTLKEVAVSTSKNVIDDDTDVAQYAQDVGSNGATIDKKHVSLKAANNSSYVYGNDDSVYLNVELKNVEVEDTTGGDQRQIVDDVESVTTGVKNVNLVMEDLKKDGNYIAPAAEIYTLYNDDGYVIAAVTIGENEGTSSNYVYVTSSNVNREAYDDETEWTWTREVVVNGELVEISEVGDSLEWIGNASKNQGEMAQGEWFEVKYDADGNVRKVEAIDFSKAADKFVDEVEDVEDAVEDFDTVLLSDTNTVEKLTFKNGTLYTDRNATKGFSVSPEVKVVLSLADKKGNEFDDVDDSYTGYNGLEKALRDMNAQGTFGTGVVEVSAILDNGVATSIVINDKAKAGSDVSNPTVPEGEFLPASWNPTTKGIELRYYEKSMSDSEIKAAIEDLLGAPVDRLNKFMGYVTLENGDMYRVNFTQIEVVAISIDGEVVSYPDKGDAANLTNIPAGNYFDINENPDGFIGGSNRGLLTVPSTGKVTVSNTNKDREFVTAYELDIDGTITSDVSAEVNGKTVSDGDYIADGEVVELTFTTAGDYTVNGELVRAAANDTYEIEATEAIMVRSVSNYMTEEDIADIVDAYNPGTPTGATITRSGDTLNIVLNNTVSDWTDVSGTGLFVLAEDLLEDNSILITFPDGSAERIDKGTNAAAAAAQLTPKLGNVSDLTPTPIVITVTVENAGSGASVEYTVNLSQAD